MKRRRLLIMLGIVALLVGLAAFYMWLTTYYRASVAPALEEGPTALEKKLDDPANPLASSITKLGPGKYQMGSITIDARASELSFPGSVNMVEGLIEVLICAKYGKVHESVFVTDVRPMDLHTCCLLLGMRDGSNPAWLVPSDPARRWPGLDRPPGSMAQLWVGWDTPEGRHEMRAEEGLMDQRTKQPLAPRDWVFIGSMVDEQGRYIADGVGSIVTSYHDPTSVFDNPLEAGRSDEFTFANTGALPPVGTPVRLRVVPAQSAPAQEQPS